MGVGAFFFILEAPQLSVAHYAMQSPQFRLLVCRHSLLFYKYASQDIFNAFIINLLISFILLFCANFWVTKGGEKLLAGALPSNKYNALVNLIRLLIITYGCAQLIIILLCLL